MEKVKVNKEVFDALEETKFWDDWSRTILKAHGGFIYKRDILSKLDILVMARIALYGYQLDKSPEDILKEKYLENFEIACTTPVIRNQIKANSFNDGVVFTLKTLGIEIEGV